MSCATPPYEFYQIFESYGQQIRDILTTDPTCPYPIYETISDYRNDVSHNFKGILVWNAQKYYSTVDATEGSEGYKNDIGFFIVPEFGNVSITPNVEYRQTVMVVFDVNTDPDYDPYSVKAIKLIDWYINRHYDLIEDINNQIILPTTNRHLYAQLDSISNPIYNTNSPVYLRRVVTHILRYCSC